MLRIRLPLPPLSLFIYADAASVAIAMPAADAEPAFTLLPFHFADEPPSYATPPGYATFFLPIAAMLRHADTMLLLAAILVSLFRAARRY